MSTLGYDGKHFHLITSTTSAFGQGKSRGGGDMGEEGSVSFIRSLKKKGIIYVI